MIEIDPQQELFTELKKQLKAKGMDVFDGALPPDGTPYPFVYLDHSQQIDELTKSYVIGTVHQSISVWHSFEKRGTVSKLLLEIKGVCRGLKSTKNFSWFCRDVDQQIMPDNTTNTPLLHGVLDITFQFS